MTPVVRTCLQDPDEAAVERLAGVLRAGGVAVVPTDSVYGLACAATPGCPGHARIFDVKRRDRAQVLPWFVSGPDDLLRYGREVPEWARRLARACWPGALTLVVRASDEVAPEYSQPAADGARTIALRVPDCGLVLRTVGLLGTPLAQTSANTHGMPAATSAAALEPAVAAGVDLVVDAGEAPVGVASTIVDATGEAPVVLREGALLAADVARLCR